MQFQQVYPGTRNGYYASLNAALADGTTALLRADFPSAAAEGRPSGTAPSCPPRRSTRPIWAETKVYPAVHGVIIVGLSYMWATADHPDPDGEQLRDVAKYLRWLQEAEGWHGTNHKGKLVAVFWDWAGLYQDSLLRPAAHGGADQDVQVRAAEREPVVLPPEHADADEPEDAGGAAVELRRQRLAGECEEDEGVGWGALSGSCCALLSYFRPLCHDAACAHFSSFPIRCDNNNHTTPLNAARAGREPVREG